MFGVKSLSAELVGRTGSAAACLPTVCPGLGEGGTSQGELKSWFCGSTFGKGTEAGGSKSGANPGERQAW